MEGLFIMAIVTGLGGAFTPCTLGVNLVMINYLTDKSKTQRLLQWTQFAVSRAAIMALLGLVIGGLGQIITSFTWWFQMGVNILIIVMGVLFILGRHKPVLPGLDFGGGRSLDKNMSPLALGALFGLNITACIAPLVLALLAQTVLVGNWLAGGLALFLFGVMLSVPILVAVFNDRASAWISKMSAKYRSIYYPIIGGVLIVLGVAEIALSMYVIPWLS
jgi:cytochrome c-type biogenesis protein